MDQEKMGKLIAKIRKEKGMTQPELGERLGVNAQAVSKWESGRNAPDISILNSLADILEVSTSDMLKGIQTKKEKKKFSDWLNKNKFFLISETLLLLIVIPLFIYFTNNFDQHYTMSLKSDNNESLITGKIIASPSKDYIILNQIFLTDLIENNSNDIYCLRIAIKNNEDILFNYKYELSDDYGNLESIELNEAINDIFPLFFETDHIHYDNLSLDFTYIDSNSEETIQTISLNYIKD